MAQAWNTCFLTALVTSYHIASFALILNLKPGCSPAPLYFSVSMFISMSNFLVIQQISYPCSLCFSDRIIHARWYVQGSVRKNKGALAVIIFANGPQSLHLM